MQRSGVKKVHVLKNYSKIVKEIIKITPSPAETSSFDQTESGIKYDIEFMF
jgi:hypothetical protein